MKMTERDKFYYNEGYNKAVEDAANLAKEPNKMMAVAAMFGKRLDERFTVDRKGYRFQARFKEYGLDMLVGWDNPYFDVSANVLQDLITGEAVIINE